MNRWLAVPVTLTLAVVVGIVTTAADPFTVNATAADITRIAIDTDITGNAATPCDTTGDPSLDYPCNNSTVLGPIDNCRVIAVGASIQIDVIGESIPLGGTNGSDMSGQGAGQSDMALDWTPNGLITSPISITAHDKSVALVHQGLDDNPAGAFDGHSGAAAVSGHWKWSDVDVNPDLVAEGGQGIAIRLTVKGLIAGTANLSLGVNQLSLPTWTDIHGNEYAFGQNNGATIIVGSGSCATSTASSSPTPSHTPSPTPTPTPTSTPTPTTTPTPTPTPTTAPTPTPTPTTSPTPGTTNSPSPTPSVTQTAPPTPSPSPTTTSIQTDTPTATPTCTCTNPVTPTTTMETATATPTPTPTPSVTPNPSCAAVSEVSIQCTPTASPSPVSGPKPGDVDCDGHMDLLDAGRLLRDLGGVARTSSDLPCDDGGATVDGRPARDDANCDGLVDTMDVLAILKASVALGELPALCS